MRVPVQDRRGLAWGGSGSSLAGGYPDKKHGVLAQFLGKLGEKGLAQMSLMLEAGLSVSIRIEGLLSQPACKSVVPRPVAPSSSGSNKRTLLRAMQLSITDPCQVLVFRGSQGCGGQAPALAAGCSYPRTRTRGDAVLGQVRAPGWLFLLQQLSLVQSLTLGNLSKPIRAQYFINYRVSFSNTKCQQSILREAATSLGESS